jgi:hypothetical protein
MMSSFQMWNLEKKVQIKNIFIERASAYTVSFFYHRSKSSSSVL